MGIKEGDRGRWRSRRINLRLRDRGVGEEEKKGEDEG
jgi:hypothetical protein